DGQMWASTLMQIYDDIGRAATDLNFLEALANTGSSSGQEDAAQAFIQADLNLHGGANLASIEYWFTQRGYTVTVPIPSITHTPLGDSEDLDGPYAVSADVVGTYLLDKVQLIYGTGGAFTDTLDMVYQSGDEYTSAIPGTGSPEDYNYYIFAVDTMGLANTHPAGAPGSYHSFSTGSDTTPPVIVHSPLGNQSYDRWPAVVQATITDNFGIDSAWVEYAVNDGTVSGSFAMVNTSGDEYSGTFDIDTTAVSVGDSIDYRMVAQDASSQENQAFHPTSGVHQFKIIDVSGVILVIDDDPVSSHTLIRSDKGDHTRDLQKNPFGKSSDDMETYLLDAGYTVVVETPAATDPGTWDSYDLIISASGINESSLSNATYRNALLAHAQNGDKYIIEGGEVGYEWRNNNSIMDDVIHSSSWNGDNEGTLNLLGSQTGHPMVTAPNSLPTSIGITYTAYGSEDAMTPTDSYLIYETFGEPGDAGISIYDDNSDITSAQCVYYAFNFAEITNALYARELLENTVDYLLTPEGVNQTPVVASAIPDTSVVENNGPIDNYRDLNDVFSDAEDGSVLAFTIESNSNPALVTVTIDPDSALDMSFALGESGSATIVIRATDLGLLFVEDTFVVTVTPAAYTLTANVVGSGSVTKNPDQPTYLSGDTVIVQAVPDTCWGFDGWSDGLSGTENPDTVVMMSDTTITANFTQGVYTLTANVVGNGSVTKTPDQPTYLCGDTVIVQAIPDPVWVFTGWSDGLSSTENPDTIAMISDTT
ncbi:MAG: hypothetical protein KAJ19_21045, partial [Gammaproteobacteria bacterium]|nr:hypothetical protein [Gammaproteobacteria bacterium]